MWKYSVVPQFEILLLEFACESRRSRFEPGGWLVLCHTSYWVGMSVTSVILVACSCHYTQTSGHWPSSATADANTSEHEDLGCRQVLFILRARFLRQCWENRTKKFSTARLSYRVYQPLRILHSFGYTPKFVVFVNHFRSGVVWFLAGDYN
jgi:hypothetical protein